MLVWKHNGTQSPTNTLRTTAQVYLSQSALWLRERQVNTFTLLYKQAGTVEPITQFSGEEYTTSDTMNKLLVITVLVALLAPNAESFRVKRQTEDTEGVVEAEVVPEVVAEVEVEPEVVAEVEVVPEVVEEQGSLAKFTDTVKSYYSDAVNTASEYLENIKGLKLEEKAKNLYTETTNVVTTYAGIMQDQIYHGLYQK
ncbi:hypothetical protein NQZ68_020957 [Dissostichus eleginoides]|nr:hypothetical protein NQZ68_020957 [Dissostichus eleginoides]